MACIVSFCFDSSVYVTVRGARLFAAAPIILVRSFAFGRKIRLRRERLARLSGRSGLRTPFTASLPAERPGAQPVADGACYLTCNLHAN